MSMSLWLQLSVGTLVCFLFSLSLSYNNVISNLTYFSLTYRMNGWNATSFSNTNMELCPTGLMKCNSYSLWLFDNLRAFWRSSGFVPLPQLLLSAPTLTALLNLNYVPVGFSDVCVSFWKFMELLWPFQTLPYPLYSSSNQCG